MMCDSPPKIGENPEEGAVMKFFGWWRRGANRPTTTGFALPELDE